MEADDLCLSCSKNDKCPDRRIADQLKQVVVLCKHYEERHENNSD